MTHGDSILHVCLVVTYLGWGTYIYQLQPCQTELVFLKERAGQGDRLASEVEDIRGLAHKSNISL